MYAQTTWHDDILTINMLFKVSCCVPRLWTWYPWCYTRKSMSDHVRKQYGSLVLCRGHVITHGNISGGHKEGDNIMTS